MTARSASGAALPRRRLLRMMVAPVVLPAPLAAQGGGSATQTRPAATPRFRIEVPEKDWRLLPGGLSSLGCLAHKDNLVAIVIEHELLQIALTPEEIDGNLADLELATVKERETGGSGFTAQLAQVGRRRAIVIDLQRRGAGGGEQVRVFVLFQGRHLYRLVCVAPSTQFARYAPTFQAVSSSFTPLDAN